MQNSEHCMQDKQILSTLLWIVAGTCIGALLVLMPLPAYPALIAGSTSLYLLLKKPEYGILVIVVLTSSIVFEESLPLVPIGVGSLQITDIILLVSAGKIISNIFFDKNYRYVSTPLDIPLTLFIAVIIYSAYNSIVNYGLDFNVVIRILRGFVYYSIFFLVTNLIKEKSQIKNLVNGMFVIAVVVAISMILQSLIGDAFTLVPGRVERAATFGEFEALRILPPGQTLIYCLMIIAMCCIRVSKRKHVMATSSFYIFLILGSGVLLTYKRDYWVVMILSFGLLIATGAKSERRKISSLFAIVSAIGACIIAFSLFTGAMRETRLAVAERFDSLFAGKELKESNPIDDRMTENFYALSKISENPLLGNGLGNDYRPDIYGKEDTLQNMVHNSYLHLLLNAGFVGTMFFICYYAIFAIRSVRYIGTVEDPYLRAVATGNFLSGIGLAVMAFANPIFLEWYSIVIISIMIGINESIIRISKTEVVRVNGQ